MVTAAVVPAMTLFQATHALKSISRATKPVGVRIFAFKVHGRRKCPYQLGCVLLQVTE